MTDTFNTPDNADVLQADEIPLAAMPVEVVGIPRVDEMPSRLSSSRNIILPAASRAQKIANYDPRRKRMILWPLNNLDTELTHICIAGTEGEANAFAGALIQSPYGIMRWEFTFADELWARPCVISDTTGIWTSYGPSTDDVILGIVTEQWAN